MSSILIIELNWETFTGLLMKTLQLGKFYPPFHGGMETVLKDLCRGLSNLSNNKVTVLCAEHSKKASSKIDQKVSVIRLKSLAVLFSQPLMPKYYFELRKLLKSTDVVHLHAPHPLAEICLTLANPKCPIIITHHSDVIRQKFLAPLHTFLVSFLYRRADAIVVPTTNHVNTSKILGRFAHKCRCIPFALNTNSLTPPDKFRVSSNAEKPYFLFVGRLVGYKGVDVLLNAFTKVNESFNLKIIGTGPLKDELKVLTRNLNLEDRVEFLGRVDSNEDFSRYYAESTALVLPSVSSNENFGMVQLEAMYYSKPIVATNLQSGVPAVAEPGVSSLLAEPGDPSSLSKSMNELANDENKVLKMGMAARLRYEKLYQLDTFINEHQKLYNELLKKSI